MTNKEKFEGWVRCTKGESFLRHSESPALWGGDTKEHDNNPYEHPWTNGAWEGYQAAIASQKTDDDWIAWCGGENPVSNKTEVVVKFRNGSTDKDSSDIFWWGVGNMSCDIIAYRVVKS